MHTVRAGSNVREFSVRELPEFSTRFVGLATACNILSSEL